MHAIDRDAMAGLDKRFDGVGDAGPGVAGVTAEINHIGAVGFEARRPGEDLLPRQSRGVIDFGDDLDVVTAIVGRAVLLSEVGGQFAQVFWPSYDRNTSGRFDGA